MDGYWCDYCHRLHPLGFLCNKRLLDLDRALVDARRASMPNHDSRATELTAEIKARPRCTYCGGEHPDETCFLWQPRDPLNPHKR